ncbi:MAG: lipid-binding SYLF domain-containing protein, partial [Ginsengibacter sp.]
PFAFTTIKSQDKEAEKVEAASKVLTDFTKMKEKIPQQLLQITQGIIVIPKLLNAGFVVGGKRGKGIAVVKREDGTWSDPAFITLTGGSIGFQVGVQSIDLVLVFKNRETLEKIGRGSFTLGGDASITAGPVGRNSSASTDYKLEAEVYSYSRSKGLFAGISLSGSALDVDSKANEAFYGGETDAATIFSNSAKKTPEAVAKLKATLESL